MSRNLGFGWEDSDDATLRVQAKEIARLTAENEYLDCKVRLMLNTQQGLTVERDALLENQRKLGTTALKILDERDALQKRSHLFGEIMAILHRDGGHYLGEHGPQKAYDDAVQRWSELMVEREALLADAERYRWLRDSGWNGESHPDVWREVTNEYGELDAAIDAAMKKEKP